VTWSVTMSELTQNLLKNHFRYENGFLYWTDFSIRPTAKKTELGTLLPNGYLYVKFFKKNQYVHRLIFLFHHGYLPKYVDHINGNKIDNRIENLRDVTHCQNMMNIKKYSLNTSGYKGVSFHKRSQKWVAQIKFNKKHLYLGLFDQPEKAYEAYCYKAKELHGEYANLG
jgi:hypothetical protein